MTKPPPQQHRGSLSPPPPGSKPSLLLKPGDRNKSRENCGWAENPQGKLVWSLWDRLGREPWGSRGAADILRLAGEGEGSIPPQLSVMGESRANGRNPDGPKEDKGVTGRGCASPNQHLPMKREKLPLFDSQATEGSLSHPSLKIQTWNITASISSSSPSDIHAQTKHLRSIPLLEHAANQASLLEQGLLKPPLLEALPPL